MKNNIDLDKAVICIVGLGYVGLPLAEAFAATNRVIGFDIDTNRISVLNNSISYANLTFTADPGELSEGDFIIICVPTPVTRSKEPDLLPVTSAAELVGSNMKKGCTVILESTVYPGVTEEVVKPILETESGLVCGNDFKIAYSPERVNPNDTQHTIVNTTKLVSGIDTETTEMVAQLYGRIIDSIYKTGNIMTAEAAKVIENIQRDLNIALVNEFSLIFDKMNLDTRDVLKAAATKWNFHQYSPGLVGGHCIPVDPYYLVYKSRELGYHPQVILAGRSINDNMPKHIAELTVKALNSAGKILKGSRVLIMGLTYKENVADTRETPVTGIIGELNEYGIELMAYDPLISNIEQDFRIQSISKLKDVSGIDAIIITVFHDVFRGITLSDLKNTMTDNPVLIDVRRQFDRDEAVNMGIIYRTL